MNAIYGCSTDMGGLFVKWQGEAAAATVVAAAASIWPGESADRVSSVSMSTRCQSEMRGLVTAGRCFESEWTAGLGSSVNPLRGNMFAHSTDAGHSETLADTFGWLIWTSVGPASVGHDG